MGVKHGTLTPFCDFCGRSVDDVKVLITSPFANNVSAICDICIPLAVTVAKQRVAKLEAEKSKKN